MTACIFDPSSRGQIAMAIHDGTRSTLLSNVTARESFRQPRTARLVDALRPNLDEVATEGRVH